MGIIKFAKKLVVLRLDEIRSTVDVGGIVDAGHSK